jgi:CRP-like cAMP-binding protein
MKAAQSLKKCQVFAGLNDSELNRVAALAEEKEYGAGAIIFKQGQDADEVMVVEDGKVALQMTLTEGPEQPSKPSTVDIITDNEILGWSAITEGYVHTLDAVCLQKTKLLSINAINLRMLLKSDRQISYAVTQGLVKVLAERLAMTRHVLISERATITRS